MAINVIGLDGKAAGASNRPTTNIMTEQLSNYKFEGGVGVDSGLPNPHMAGYVPKKYSGKLLRKFYEETVLSEIANTEYEGEIRQYGDTVIIRTTPDIQVYDYSKGQDLDYNTYDSETHSLTIRYGKYWAFVTNPIDIAQTDIKNFVENWTTDAAHRMKVAIEHHVFGAINGSAGAGNFGNTAGKVSKSYDLGSDDVPVEITKDNIIDVISNCGAVMGEQDLPVIAESNDFWMVAPQWFLSLLGASALSSADKSGRDPMYLTGGSYKVPQIDVFKIYRSNLVPVTRDAGSNKVKTTILFGHKCALTFASQLVQNETFTNPKQFGQLHRGLQIYGFEVIQPKALGRLVCYKSAAVYEGDETSSTGDGTNTPPAGGGTDTNGNS